MWKGNGTKNSMYLRLRKFFPIAYLTIVLMIFFGSSVISTVSGSSVSDYKKPSRLHSRGANDVFDSSHPREYENEDYDDYSSEIIGHTLDPEDSAEVTNWESDHHYSEEHSTPSIAKCCRDGEALNVESGCTKLDPNYKHDLTWHPSNMYVVANETWVPFNTDGWEVVSPFKVSCPPNQTAEVVSDLGKFVLISDGGLFLSHQRRHLDSHEFCFEQQIGKAAGRAIMACFTQAELGVSSKTLRKCCPDNTMVQMMDHKLVCFLPPTRKNIAGNWTVVHGSPVCEIGEYVLEIPANDTIRIGEDGMLITETVKAPFQNYCLDHFKEHENEDNPSIKALLCMTQKDIRPRDASHFRMPPALSGIYGAALIVSSVCLALAALISLRLPELRSLHGKCQLSHLATLFSLFVLLATVHLGSQSIPPGLCTFFAVAIHFCALSSFLWLNLLCVNIYLTFRSLRPPLAARRGETRRLFFLCVYAWGIPAAFCLFLWILDKPGILDPMPSPEYGKLKCLISNREAEFAYLFGPVGLLLLLNGILFCLTAQELLCGLWRLDNSDSINFRRKSMGIVVAKLAIVMGMGWIFDVTSWGAGPKYTYLFFTADIFNSLQGLFIFIVLIWRKRVLEVLHIRKPSIIKDETLTGRPFLHKHSTLSQTLTNGDQDTSLISAQDI